MNPFGIRAEAVEVGWLGDDTPEVLKRCVEDEQGNILPRSTCKWVLLGRSVSDLLARLTETLSIEVASGVQMVALASGLRLTELDDPEGLIVFSGDEPVTVAELCAQAGLVEEIGQQVLDQLGQRWCLFGDADGTAILVTGGETVWCYRDGELVSTEITFDPPV